MAAKIINRGRPFSDGIFVPEGQHLVNQKALIEAVIKLNGKEYPFVETLLQSIKKQHPGKEIQFYGMLTPNV